MNNGSYDLEGVIWHQHSNLLMATILGLWPDKNTPIVDLGCGHNFYSNVLNYAGYASVGSDFVKLKSVDYKVDLTKAIPKNHDLNYYQKNNSNVISLEVGEHLPEDLSKNYLDNICSFGGEVIMSWAVPGQAGVGHINCQSNEWVIDKMFERGYILDPGKTHQLRENVTGCHCSWFKNTLMYFNPKTK